MNSKLFIFISMALIAQTSAMAETPPDEVQKVYEYQNSQGVTEFTDTVKTNQEPVKELQIEKTTPEEEARSKAKLEQIIEKDKELDERVKLQRQLENERIKTQQKSTKPKDNNSADDSDHNEYWRRVPYGVRPPHKPVRPKPLPKPRPRPLR